MVFAGGAAGFGFLMRGFFAGFGFLCGGFVAGTTTAALVGGFGVGFVAFVSL